ncbi:MAG: hypothetical protein MUF84_15730 [Anaerolineae bacterium]|nr:hypothetical protein [Anaerolineae bacterium]
MLARIARICAGVLLVVLVGTGGPVMGQGDVPPVPAEGASDPQEMVPQSRTSPDISFIDSPSAVCYQANPGQNQCFVNWQYLYVTSTPLSYMNQMTVTIDNRVRAVYQGFFTTALFASGDMHGAGFVVPCGALGISGNPLLGKTHSYTVTAVDTSGLKSANYGSVTCPGVRMVYLPLTLRG